MKLQSVIKGKRISIVFILLSACLLMIPTVGVSGDLKTVTVSSDAHVSLHESFYMFNFGGMDDLMVADDLAETYAKFDLDAVCRDTRS